MSQFFVACTEGIPFGSRSVRVEGFAPSRDFSHQLLRLARLLFRHTRISFNYLPAGRQAPRGLLDNLFNYMGKYRESQNS